MPIHPPAPTAWDPPVARLHVPVSGRPQIERPSWGVLVPVPDTTPRDEGTVVRASVDA